MRDQEGCSRQREGRAGGGTCGTFEGQSEMLGQREQEGGSGGRVREQQKGGQELQGILTAAAFIPSEIGNRQLSLPFSPPSFHTGGLG